ncbi:hypothetical protein JHK82_055195 [Glycine max]|nr:hypothetical protein JHK85_056008 [Glycine max]KAG5073825.1 hypothetical protein JHK84_055056 [Glycine max]KAG5076500.1 hypothetical protein JHK82_055195 [Glycine max]
MSSDNDEDELLQSGNKMSTTSANPPPILESRWRTTSSHRRNPFLCQNSRRAKAESPPPPMIPKSRCSTSLAAMRIMSKIWLPPSGPKPPFLINRGFTGPIPVTIGNLEWLVFLSINSNGFTGPIPAAIVLKEYLHSAELRDIMQCSTRMKHATNEDRDGRNCTGAGGLNDSRLGVLQEPSDGLTVGLVAELSG